MKKPVILFSFLFILFGLATNIHAQSRGGMLQGTITEEKVIRTTILVRDTTTGKQSEKPAYIYKLVPIKGVRVELKNSGISTLTDTTGKYFIQGIPRGLYDIYYSADGYKSDAFGSVFIKRDTITEIDISLERNESAASEIPVSASRFEQKLQSVPVSVALPDPGFLTRQSPVSIDEGLRYVPGVSVSGEAMSIRASGNTLFSPSSRTALFLDNQPVMSSVLGNIGWYMFPTDFLERAEVIKGGSSSLYGSGAMAGVVSLLLPTTPARFRSGTRLRTYGGFYDQSAAQTRLLGGAEASHTETFGDFNIYGSIGRFTDEGYRENSDFKRWRFFSKSVYHFSSQSELALIASFAEENRGNNLRWQSFDNALQDGDSSLTNFYSGSLLLAPSYKTTLSRVATLLARGRYLRTNLHESGHGYGEDQFGLETQMVIDFGSGYAFTGGLEGRHSSATSTAFGDHQASGFGIYLQSESPLIESVQMTYGVRYDGEWVDDGQYWGQISPRIGAAVTLSETSALYANLSKGFRFASLAERFGSPLTAGLPILPNNELDPEQSVTYEAGYRYSRIRPVSLASWLRLDRIVLVGSIYFTRYKNLIEPVKIGTDSLLFENSNGKQLWGIDFSSSLEFNNKSFILSLGYTYTNPEDEANANAIAYRSRHLFYSSLHFNYGIFSLECSYRFIGKFAATNPDITAILEKYGTKDGGFSGDAHILDMRLGTTLSYGLGIDLLVKNVFDKKYVERPAMLAQPRQFVLQLSADL